MVCSSPCSVRLEVETFFWTIDLVAGRKWPEWFTACFGFGNVCFHHLYRKTIVEPSALYAMMRTFVSAVYFLTLHRSEDEANRQSKL